MFKKRNLDGEMMSQTKVNKEFTFIIIKLNNKSKYLLLQNHGSTNFNIPMKYIKFYRWSSGMTSHIERMMDPDFVDAVKEFNIFDLKSDNKSLVSSLTIFYAEELTCNLIYKFHIIIICF